MTRHLIIILGDQLNLDNPALDDFDAAKDMVTKRVLFCFYPPCVTLHNRLKAKRFRPFI